MELKLPPDFKEFLKLLIEKDVRYLLIGGYAVGRYQDLPDLENLPLICVTKAFFAAVESIQNRMTVSIS